MALPSPSPFTIPLLTLTYITRQQRVIHASRAAARLGRKQCDPLLLREALPKIHTVGFSIPPAQNTYGGAPSLPYPTTSLTLRSQNSNYGQLTPKGHTWDVVFCTPPFWAHVQVTQIQKNGGCNFGNTPFCPPRGHLPFFAVLDS